MKAVRITAAQVSEAMPLCEVRGIRRTDSVSGTTIPIQIHGFPATASQPNESERRLQAGPAQEKEAAGIPNIILRIVLFFPRGKNLAIT